MENEKGREWMKGSAVAESVDTVMLDDKLKASQKFGVSYAILAGAEALLDDITKDITPDADGNILIPKARLDAVKGVNLRLLDTLAMVQLVNDLGIPVDVLESILPPR